MLDGFDELLETVADDSLKPAQLAREISEFVPGNCRLVILHRDVDVPPDVDVLAGRDAPADDDASELQWAWPHEFTEFQLAAVDPAHAVRYLENLPCVVGKDEQRAAQTRQSLRDPGSPLAPLMSNPLTIYLVRRALEADALPELEQSTSATRDGRLVAANFVLSHWWKWPDGPLPGLSPASLVDV